MLSTLVLSNENRLSAFAGGSPTSISGGGCHWPKALITGICSSFVGIATLIVVTIAYTDDWKWEYIKGKPVNGKDEY